MFEGLRKTSQKMAKPCKTYWERWERWSSTGPTASAKQPEFNLSQ
jgi:hypothetical protein